MPEIYDAYTFKYIGYLTELVQNLRIVYCNSLHHQRFMFTYGLARCIT